MKTAFEKRAKYDMTSWIFGVPKKRYRYLYFLLLIFFIAMSFLFSA